MNILYSLQHVGFVIPPQADAGWIGEAGPGPSYLDPGSGGPENDFTNRNVTFMTWNLLHMARILKRSEEHTSELQSLMRISYAVFCLTKKTITLLYPHYQAIPN